MTREEWVVIGVSGVTCGGKTTLTNRLKGSLSPVYIFHQDKYFYPDDSPKHVKCEGLDHNNYDILSALDMETMYSDIVKTLDGDDRSHEKCLDRDNRYSCGKKFLVIDGFCALNYKPILDMCDLKYYFVLEYGVCMSRRVLRVYDPPDVAGYFETCVWPEHIKYRAEIEKDKSIILLDGTSPDVYDIVMEDIKSFTK